MTTYIPGDVVRLTVNAPHNTYLLAGDTVTVAAVKRDEHDRALLLVHTDQGLRLLYATDVEMVTAAYRPAVPDPEVDAVFSTLLETDLADVFDTAADTALGAVEEQLAPVLVNGEPITPDGRECAHPWDVEGEDCDFTYTDFHGDELTIYYGERPSPTDGTREGGFFFAVNEDDEDTPCVLIRADSIGPLLRWIMGRVTHSRRPEDPPATAAAAA